jgi:hypothetical protein
LQGLGLRVTNNLLHPVNIDNGLSVRDLSETTKLATASTVFLINRIIEAESILVASQTEGDRIGCGTADGCTRGKNIDGVGWIGRTQGTNRKLTERQQASKKRNRIIWPQCFGRMKRLRKFSGGLPRSYWLGVCVCGPRGGKGEERGSPEGVSYRGSFFNRPTMCPAWRVRSSDGPGRESRGSCLPIPTCASPPLQFPSLGATIPSLPIHRMG